MNKRTMVLCCVAVLMASQCFAAVLSVYTNIAAADGWWILDQQTSTIADGGYVLSRELQFLDNRSSDDLAALLVAESTFTNPKADLQTYTGTFVNSAVTVKETTSSTGQRSVTITHTMIRVNTLTGSESAVLATNLSTFTSINTRDNAILNLFGLQTGEGDNQGFIFANMNPSSANKTACMDTITDADLVAQLAVGWTYADRQWKEDKDGTAMFAVGFRKVSWTNTWSQADLMGDGSTGGYARVRTEIVDGVPNSSRATVLAAALVPDTGYVVAGVSISETADGSISANSRQATAYTNTTHATSTAVFYKSEYGGEDRITKCQWKRVTTTTKDTLIGTGGAAISEWAYIFPGDTNTTTNAHVSVSIQDNGDGTYDVLQNLINASVTWSTVDGEKWNASVTNYYYQTRTGDNQKRKFTYVTQMSARRSYEKAADAIEAAGAVVNKVKYGSETITKIGTGTWLAKWDEYISIDNWADLLGEP